MAKVLTPDEVVEILERMKGSTCDREKRMALTAAIEAFEDMQTIKAELLK